MRILGSSRNQVKAKMKKILFILHLPPPVHGAAMMGKYIHDSEWINSEFNCSYINLTTASSLEDIGKVGLRKLTTFVRLLMKIRRAVTEQTPDLVYITPNSAGGAFYKDFVVVMMLKMLGCRIVAHYHNKGIATRQDRWLDNMLYRHFFKDIKVILLAEPLYADVRKYVSRESVYICPNGIPEEHERHLETVREDNVPHLLFLSNLLIDKGVLVLLDALKILKNRGYSFVCNFVGGETAEIDAQRFTEEVGKRALNGMALYKGKKYGADKAAEFEASDIFVLPSLNEAFPLVNLEAMSYKKPIVSTNVGGITEAVVNGENGLICESNDPNAMAHCLQRLFDEKDLCIKMGNEGYKIFKERFTDKVFLKRLRWILVECLEQENY